MKGLKKMDKVIAFSAGHGMSSRRKGHTDPGAKGYGEVEATLTHEQCENLSKDFARLGWKVLFRDNGRFDLADDEAYKFGAKVFVEYHLNAGGPAANGAEVWVASRILGKEVTLANNILNRIVNIGFRDRGIKRSDELAVLRQYKRMDSVLIEPCFITNQKDNAKYEKVAGKVELAIVNGILETYGLKPVKSRPRTWGKMSAYLYRITHR